jgi:hypothetical protein
MPRKYKPVITRDNPYGDLDFMNLSATMQESKEGTWVPLKVFKDEVTRLTAQIQRLQSKLDSFPVNYE